MSKFLTAKIAVSSGLTRKVNSNVVGVDLSLTSTGVVCLTGDGMLDSYNIKTKPSDFQTDVHRIAFIAGAVADILQDYEELEDRPTLVCLEGYAMGARGSRVFTIGELGGVVKQWLYGLQTDTLIVPPTVLKKFLGIGGNSDKDQVRLELFKKYGVELKTNDECDAAVLALMAHTKISELEGADILKYQKEALDKCELLEFDTSNKFS